MTEPYLVVDAVERVPLLPMPINPTWITGGAPDATGVVPVLSDDGLLFGGIWHCEPGEFDWHYDWDEVSLILDGVFVLEAEAVPPRRIEAGALVLFRSGTTVHWRVEKPVRKLYVVRAAGG